MKDGYEVEIRGRKGTVCYNTEYNNEKYICVGFTDDGLKYEIYRYKFEDDKFLVSKVDNQEELLPVMQIFLRQGLSEVGLPKAFQCLTDEEND